MFEIYVQVHYHSTFLLCRYASLNGVRKIKVQRRPWGTVMYIHQFTEVCSDRYRVSHPVTTRELFQGASIPGHMTWSQPYEVWQITGVMRLRSIQQHWVPWRVSNRDSIIKQFTVKQSLQLVSFGYSERF